MAGRNNDQTLDLTVDQSRHSFLLPLGVFLTVCEENLIIGIGGTHFDPSNDGGEKADRYIRHNDANRTRTFRTQAHDQRIRTVVQGRDGLLDSLLKFCANKASASETI